MSMLSARPKFIGFQQIGFPAEARWAARRPWHRRTKALASSVGSSPSRPARPRFLESRMSPKPGTRDLVRISLRNERPRRSARVLGWWTSSEHRRGPSLRLGAPRALSAAPHARALSAGHHRFRHGGRLPRHIVRARRRRAAARRRAQRGRHHGPGALCRRGRGRRLAGPPRLPRLARGRLARLARPPGAPPTSAELRRPPPTSAAELRHRAPPSSAELHRHCPTSTDLPRRPPTSAELRRPPTSAAELRRRAPAELRQTPPTSAELP